MATEITDFSSTAASNTFNWPENMAPSAVNNAGREDEAILAKWYLDTGGSLASGGSANAYTLTLNRTKFEVSAAFDGFLLAFQANFTNTGAATLDVTPAGGAAKGAKAIVKNGNTALTSGDIVAGQAVLLVYDNSQDNFQMVSAPSATTGLSNVVEDTSPQLGGDLDLNGNNLDFPTTPNISDCLDEDTLVSDSATALATQQSIKAYVDTEIAGVLTAGTEIATTSGTAHTFTGIPSGTQRITMTFEGVSLSGTDQMLVQLGDAGGLETTGYVSASTQIDAAPNQVTSTSGFIMASSIAGSAHSGTMTLVRSNAAGFTWISSHAASDLNNPFGMTGGGHKSLSAELTQISLTRTGTDTFDAGAINILYE